MSSNDESYGVGMVGWPISSLNSLKVSSKEDCLGGKSYDEGFEKGFLDCR